MKPRNSATKNGAKIMWSIDGFIIKNGEGNVNSRKENK